MRNINYLCIILACIFFKNMQAQTQIGDVTLLEREKLFAFFSVTTEFERNDNKAKENAVSTVIRTLMTQGVPNFNGGRPLVDADKFNSSSIEAFFKKHAYNSCARPATNVFAEGPAKYSHFIVKVKYKAIGGLISILQNPPYKLMGGTFVE
ncbi:MAG: hypothetical protein IJ832_02280 [Bacteroidaceae bacterium]|nr:hypothetical protein [Bacteroidaceae bacterium]